MPTRRTTPLPVKEERERERERERETFITTRRRETMTFSSSRSKSGGGGGGGGGGGVFFFFYVVSIALPSLLLLFSSCRIITETDATQIRFVNIASDASLERNLRKNVRELCRLVSAESISASGTKGGVEDARKIVEQKLKELKFDSIESFDLEKYHPKAHSVMVGTKVINKPRRDVNSNRIVLQPLRRATSGWTLDGIGSVSEDVRGVCEHQPRDWEHDAGERSRRER